MSASKFFDASIMFIFGVLIIFGIVAVIITIVNERKSSFINRSTHGFFYDVSTMRFANRASKEIAIRELVKDMKQKGHMISIEQANRLSDLWIIQALEPEDDIDVKLIHARIMLNFDPDFVIARQIASDYRRSRTSLTQENRTLVFGLLVKYFNAVNDAINSPLSQWSDQLLIQAFMSLRKPRNM